MDQPTLVLSFDTTTRGGSVAITRGNSLLAWTVGEAESSHSNTLLRDIDKVLDRADLSLEEIHLFAAASGPGSFTGLRIGLATAKGLAETLGTPCVGIPTLEAIASGAGPSEATVALLPAGRGELFAQLFSISSSGSLLALDEAAHLAPERMLERYKRLRRIVWAGEGAYVQLEKIRAFAEQNGITFTDSLSVQRLVEGGQVQEQEKQSVWILAPKESNLAREIAALALAKYEQGQKFDPYELKAIYVRPSDAELKRKCL